MPSTSHYYNQFIIIRPRNIVKNPSGDWSPCSVYCKQYCYKQIVLCTFNSELSKTFIKNECLSVNNGGAISMPSVLGGSYGVTK